MIARIPFPPNPGYGPGTTRRRIRLRSGAGRVDGTLTDNFHRMRCTLWHDGQRVKSIEGEMLRIPTSNCPAAARMLQELVDWPLRDALDLYRGGRAFRHCTHLFDLAVSVLLHATREPGERVYDATVPDQTGVPVQACLHRDGEPAHQWTLLDQTIVEPAALAGQPVLEGFRAWASTRFDGEELEAALILAKTCFVARGRAHRIEDWAGRSLADYGEATGVCYAYAPERIGSGTIHGTNVRDFSRQVDEGA